MLKNYLKQIRRSLVKNKAYSILNIAGLCAGLTCFGFIALWVSDELSYDKFNKNYERIVRLTGEVKTESGITESAVSSAPMAKALKDDYAEVEDAVRLAKRGDVVLHKGQSFYEPGILLTDASFFNVFSYKLSRGNPVTALSEPYSIILTESAAKKYFGNDDPMGQSLTVLMYDPNGQGAAYKVTGIMPDPPANSHFTFNILASFKTIEKANPNVMTADGWGDARFYTYLLLKKGVDHKRFSGKITQFYKKYIGEMADVWRSIYFYKLQPLSDVYLKSHLQYDIAVMGNINNIYLFSAIGIFILLLAGINYINLSTARSISKAKEISIKKVVGAGRKQLILQYLLESVVTAIIALATSLLLSSFLKPFFIQLTGKNLSLFSSWSLLFLLIAVTFLMGILSGIYPAMIISGFKPSVITKGAFKSSSKGVFLRKSLVISQFTITLVLVVCIIVINSQMSYIKHKDLGYNKNALLFLRVNGNTDVINGYEAFKNDLLANPLVSGITTSNSLIGGSSLGSGVSETSDNTGNPLQVNTARLRVDPDYLKVYGIKLLAGRDFTKNSVTDTIFPIILNEAAVKKIGWESAEAAIGKPFKMGSQKGIVTGIVNNFHFNSLYETIGPLAIYPVEGRFSRITVKVDATKASQSISLIEDTWKKHFPAALLDYNFLDRELEEQYKAEERFSKIFLGFSILSLLIACLGLYGLISYAASQKVKEIGIRKVLGATARGIAVMLSKDFLKLIFLALFLASPVAWLIMNKWLQDFAYRTDVSWRMFAVAGSLVLLVALFTISFQAIKAAVANPVKSLRTE